MKKLLLFLSAALVLAPGALKADWEPIGPEGGWVYALAADPADPALMYAALYERKIESFSRIFRSTDRGANWAEWGEVPFYAVTNLVVDRHDGGVLYSAGRTSSLFVSSDSGVTWDSVPLGYRNYGSQVCCDPFVPGRVYMAGYAYITSQYEAMVWISDDYGQSWMPYSVDPDTTSLGYSIAASPVDSGTLYIGCSYGKLYKTTDAGLTWERADAGLPSNAYSQQLAINPGNPDIVLTALTRGGLYRTTNGGQSWSPAMTGPVCNLVCFSPADPGIGYAGYDTLYVTSDSGATWTKPLPGMVQTSIGMFMPHPDSAPVAYACGNEGILRTEDAGQNWTESNNGVRVADVSCITVSREDPDRVYLEVFQNGVFKTLDGGQTWTRCADFLSCGNICGIGVAPGAEADVLFALEGAG